MRGAISLAVSLLALSTACHAAPSERAFSDEMLERMRTAYPEQGMRAKADEPLVLQKGKVGAADEAVVNLHRVYQYCLNAPAPDCEASKQEFVAKIGIKPPKPEAGELRLIVRGEEYVDYIRQSFGSSGRFIEPRRIGDDLYAVLAFDGPSTISVANTDMLKELHLAADAAWALAERQTKARLPALLDGKKLAANATAYQDAEYLGSLLADIEGWRRVAADAGPDMFVTVVSDQFVFVGLMPDGARLDRFKQTVADDCLHQQRCTSSSIYRFRDGRWTVAK